MVMIIASGTQFHFYLLSGQENLVRVLLRDLKTDYCETDRSYAGLDITHLTMRLSHCDTGAAAVARFN